MDEQKSQDAENCGSSDLQDVSKDQECIGTTPEIKPGDVRTKVKVDDKSLPSGSSKLEMVGSKTPSPAEDDVSPPDYFNDDSHSEDHMNLQINEDEMPEAVRIDEEEVSNVVLEVSEEVIIADSSSTDASSPSAKNAANALDLPKDSESSTDIIENPSMIAEKNDEPKVDRTATHGLRFVKETTRPLVREENEESILPEMLEIEPENESDEAIVAAESVVELKRQDSGDDEDEKVPKNDEEISFEEVEEVTEVSSENEGIVAANNNERNTLTANDTSNSKSNVQGTLKSTESLERSSSKSSDNRSVVQEIVDEWVEENNDNDEGDTKSVANDSHDLVEIELKSLLAEDKPGSSGGTSASHQRGEKHGEQSTAKADEPKPRSKVSNKDLSNGSENVSPVDKDSNSNTTSDGGLPPKQIDPNAPVPDYIPPHLLGRTLSNPEQDPMMSKCKAQTPRPGVKVPGRHLTSQIASTADVSKVLKERIKLKYKELDKPRGGDISFVRKITQRLSSKLSNAPAHTSRKQAQSSSENHSYVRADSERSEGTKNTESADNRELLAILEGDVDPDWSNLKPHSIGGFRKTPDPEIESTLPQKMDPLVERELALKQLLELPSISTKKNAAKNKRTFKPASNKASGTSSPAINASTREAKGRATAVETEESKLARSDEEDEPSSTEPSPHVRIKLEDDENDDDEKDDLDEDAHLDESRSGRKRKPTERVRKNEQNASKKQKVYKGKIVPEKRTQGQQGKASRNVRSSMEPEDDVEVLDPTASDSEEPGSSEEPRAHPSRSRVPYQPKSPNPGRKLSQHNNATRAIPAKKLIRQKPSSNPARGKSVNLSSKILSCPKKRRSSINQKVLKRLIDENRPKKKTNEIDKLLQDEGVVNLLYDVEQPDKKRLVPITKSQTKVMDLHKVQRELKMRTKMVRNAVLRLNTLPGVTPTKMSPRSKRMMTHATNVVQVIDKEQQEPSKSTRTSASSPTDFIVPAKIRNAAEHSVIIRRHSTSSYSSTSGSPRVSVDSPEKMVDESPAHVTRSTRRRHSQNRQPTEMKKLPPGKKKTPESGASGDEEFVESDTPLVQPNSRVEVSKIVEKTTKGSPGSDKGKATGSTSGGKIATRSNGTMPAKVTAKSKRVPKTKVTPMKTDDDDDVVTEVAEHDELSACLAKAVSALFGVDRSVNRSGNPHPDRKQKGATEPAENSRNDVINQIDNKEMKIQRHGNLVQLILSPSSTVLENGLTIELMHEFREVLSVLRKDERCRVVLVTSTGSNFCGGLDLSSLLIENREERRARAEEIASELKEFVKSLANFNKPIVVGVHGPAVGLAVTMLPLFDLVIASNNATFSTPYGQLGQIPEGTSVFTLSQSIGHATINELLLGGRTLTAIEALRRGLVTRVLWPEPYEEDLIPSLQEMSERSSQSMEATKTLLRHNLRKKLDAALESESYVLIQHWCSAECQTLIKTYIDANRMQ